MSEEFLNLDYAKKLYKLDKRTNYEKVKEWNISFGVETKPQYDENALSHESMGLALSLIEEEINEFVDADESFDVPEVYDALCDIMVVLYGFMARIGLTMEDIKDGAITNIMNTSFNGHLRNKRILEGRKENLLPHYDLSFSEAFENLAFSVKEKIKLGIINAVKVILYLIYYNGCLYGFDIDYGLHLVNLSNESKMCPDEQTAKETVDWYKDSKRYKDISYKESDRGFIVFEKSGKILKNIHWKKVPFRELL